MAKVLLLLFLVAIVMALCGIFGFQRGTIPTLVAFIIQLVGFVLINKSPGQVVAMLNAMYRTTLLMSRGGLSDFIASDFEAVANKMQGIQVPFRAGSEDVALFLVFIVLAGLGLLAARVFKKIKKSFLGAILGIAYGYIFSAGVFPLVFNVSTDTLPVPLIRPAGPDQGLAAQFQDLLGVSRFADMLSLPGTTQALTVAILIGMALILILSVRRANKKG